MRWKLAALVLITGLWFATHGAPAGTALAWVDCDATGSIDSEELAFRGLINQHRDDNDLHAASDPHTIAYQNRQPNAHTHAHKDRHQHPHVDTYTHRNDDAHAVAHPNVYANAKLDRIRLVAKQV